jgi:hypothetical protein
LGIFALAGWRFGGGSRGLVAASKIFTAVWLVAALVNMWIGVSRAGYSVAEEFPIFAVIFVIPAAVAAFVGWKAS